MIVKFKKWNCYVEFNRYSQNDRVAIQLVEKDSHDPIAMATVNIDEVPVGEDECLIKDYSENEGVLEALEKAGVVKFTGKTFKSGWVDVHLCKILIPVTEN
jgi:hypothetical protein